MCPVYPVLFNLWPFILLVFNLCPVLDFLLPPNDSHFSLFLPSLPNSVIHLFVFFLSVYLSSSFILLYLHTYDETRRGIETGGPCSPAPRLLTLLCCPRQLWEGRDGEDNAPN